jgi:hypothetical protein
MRETENINIRKILDYNGKLYAIGNDMRLKILSNAFLDKLYKLQGKWFNMNNHSQEYIISIAKYNNNLMSIGRDNYLYKWENGF